MPEERTPLQSIIFSIDECCDAWTALVEVNKIYKQFLGANQEDRKKLIPPSETIVALLGITRDAFCVRVANLLDKRKNINSLKNVFSGDVIKKLEKHPIVIASVAARHNNICHIGKKYTKWPEVDDIVNAKDLKELLEGIKNGVIISK